MTPCLYSSMPALVSPPTPGLYLRIGRSRGDRPLIETVCHFLGSMAVLARRPPCWERQWTYPCRRILIGSTSNTHFHYQHHLCLVCFNGLLLFARPNLCMCIYPLICVVHFWSVISVYNSYLLTVLKSLNKKQTCISSFYRENSKDCGLW